MDMFNPPHPGDVLREYLPAGMQVTEAATKLGVSRVTLSRVLNGHAAISADMALRLEGALGTGASMWVGMQADYDLWQARQRPQPKVKRLAA
jgi:addiction module HigA family antidote